MSILQKIDHMMDKMFTKKQSRFIGAFAVVFLGTAALLAATGLLPSELQVESNGNNIVDAIEHSALGILSAKPGTTYTTSTPNTAGAAGTKPGQNDDRLIVPDRMSIPALGISTVVRNPTSTNINTLDFELTKGAVRYPGSGTIGKGNMFIFGHSTGLSVVQNKAYKVFNQLKNAQKGDEILLQSGQTTFVYKVRTVTKVDKNETLIKFDTTANMLTISTCNSFGAKTDRYVVEADYVGVRAM